MSTKSTHINATIIQWYVRSLSYLVTSWFSLTQSYSVHFALSISWMCMCSSIFLPTKHHLSLIKVSLWVTPCFMGVYQWTGHSNIAIFRANIGCSGCFLIHGAYGIQVLIGIFTLPDWDTLILEHGTSEIQTLIGILILEHGTSQIQVHIGIFSDFYSHTWNITNTSPDLGCSQTVILIHGTSRIQALVRMSSGSYSGSRNCKDTSTGWDVFGLLSEYRPWLGCPQILILIHETSRKQTLFHIWFFHDMIHLIFLRLSHVYPFFCLFSFLSHWDNG